MLPIALVLLLSAPQSAARPFPFEIGSNKPFVPVTVDGSAPQWFILDTGCSGTSIIARECADRLRLQRGAEDKVEVGAGSGADVGLATASRALRLGALGETLAVAAPRVLTLAHVARLEGRRVDGLLGGDFLARHVVEIDYARRQITIRDTAAFIPPPDAPVIPLNLDTGWPVVEGTITPRGGTPIPCRLIIDTGVRNIVTLFQPFSEKHGLHDTRGSLSNAVIGGGVGGASRGDVARLDALALGSLSFPLPVAVFSRDTSGIFALDILEGIVGGELLRRHRTTFDYPHGRMILEPYAAPGPFEYDMSGLFMASEAPDFTKITIMAVQARTPAADAGLEVGDEIVSIDDRPTPKLTLDDARALLRAPVARQLEIRRHGTLLRVRLQARRLV